jgi:hypothetical protein
MSALPLVWLTVGCNNIVLCSQINPEWGKKFFQNIGNNLQTTRHHSQENHSCEYLKSHSSSRWKLWNCHFVTVVLERDQVAQVDS